MKDYYQLLQISQEASTEEIRKAFRREAKKYHPDLYQGDSSTERQEFQKRFVAITQAYETLSSPVSRREYDSKLKSYQAQTDSTRQQKTHTKTSYSSSKPGSSESTFRRSSGSSFYTEPEETLDDLLKDVEELLSRFGLQFKDPLEILVDWARRIFKLFTEAMSGDDSESDHFEQTGRSKSEDFNFSSAQDSEFKDIEEELERLKRQHRNPRQEAQPKSSKATSTKKSYASDVEKEFNALKKKYGKL